MSHASGDLQQIDWEDWKSAVESKEVVILSLIANYEPTNVKETEEALANGTKTSTTPSDVLDFSLREVLTLLKDESLAERAAVYYANYEVGGILKDTMAIMKVTERAEAVDRHFEHSAERVSMPVFFIFSDGQLIDSWDYNRGLDATVIKEALEALLKAGDAEQNILSTANDNGEQEDSKALDNALAAIKSGIVKSIDEDVWSEIQQKSSDAGNEKFTEVVASMYASQVKWSIIDPENHGGWPFRSYLLGEVTVGAITNGLLSKYYEEETPLLAYTLICPVLVTKAEGILEELEEVIFKDPFYRKLYAENESLWKYNLLKE